jgi:ubiquinone/menaquinone biosynthesis C-methylase UbiE
VADAHALPFPTGTFDAVLTKSVLVFTDPKRAASEMYRVLKLGGCFGSNELTVLNPLPARSRELLAELGINVNFRSEWKAVFMDAGI